jgi:DNA-binding winged helix-turn-helix (wHTH) protein
MNDCRKLVQLPANADEMSRLVERLEIRTPDDTPTPQVDSNGILRFRGRLVPLSPIEERLARALVDDPGSVVSRSRLVSDTWEGKAVRLASLRTGVTRLRRRIAPLGLTVRAVRGRGYTVEASTRHQA